MSLRIDLADGVNSAEAVKSACQGIEAGLLVRVQAGGSLWVMTDATSAVAVERFWGLSESGPASLMISGPEAASDYVVELGEFPSLLLQGRHGPMTVEFPLKSVNLAHLEQLPEVTRRLVQRDDHIGLSPPSDYMSRLLISGVSGPLLVCTAESTPADESVYDVSLTDSAAGSPANLTVVRIDGASWTITQQGSLSAEDLRYPMALKIVFVCTGNTCRSPIAEAMCRHLLAERLGCAPEDLRERGFHVASAGIAAMPGAPASPESVDVCAEQGVDLQGHASQPLSGALLEQSDRLYTMTAGHRDAILSRYPHLEEHVELLSRTGQDVSDPIGWGRAAYEQCYAEITENLRVLVDELTNPSGDRPVTKEM